MLDRVPYKTTEQRELDKQTKHIAYKQKARKKIIKQYWRDVENQKRLARNISKHI